MISTYKVEATYEVDANWIKFSPFHVDFRFGNTLILF